MYTHVCKCLARTRYHREFTPFTVPPQGISGIKRFLHKGVASKLMGNSTGGAVSEFAERSFLARRLLWTLAAAGAAQTNRKHCQRL